MTYAPIPQALFSGLVMDENEQTVATTMVGQTPCYVIWDKDFKRHVEAAQVDRQVLQWLHQQALANRTAVTEGMLTALGRDDLFTKAMIDASLENADKNFDQLLEQGLPENVRAWLGMLGFRVTVNIHGEVVRIDQPGLIADE